MNPDDSSKIAKCLYIAKLYLVEFCFYFLLCGFFFWFKMLEKKEISQLGRYIRKRHSVLERVEFQAMCVFAGY